MINLAQFSGGKDSTAMLLWMKEQDIEFTPVFCDTGWEHPLTYAYIEEINQTLLDGRLVVLRNEKVDGFAGLTITRGLFPRQRSRFCTDYLKLKPIHAYIESLDDEVTAFLGVRKEESKNRANAKRIEWTDMAGGYWIERPLLDWTVKQVFAFHKKYGIRENPLYRLGAGRVGCWPCAFISQRELRALLKSTPEIKPRLRELEESATVVFAARQAIGDFEVGKVTTFFPHGYIPDRFCSKRHLNAEGNLVGVPTCDDVFHYLESVDENQLPLFDTPKCLSIYNLCE